MFGRNLCDKVLNIIEEWSPKKKYSKEIEYRDDLMEFIRKELKRSQQNILFGTPETHCVKKESGRHLADIGIDEDIGVELKLNLRRKAEMDRLEGQVSGFSREYSCIIIVLCGKVSDEIVEELEYRFRQRYGNVGFGIGPQGPRVEIVRKDESSTKRRKKKGSDTIFGIRFDPFGLSDASFDLFGSETKKKEKDRKKRKEDDPWKVW
ncbi:MAG: hypothetical protein ACXQS7_00600 [Candidatus Syntropharchaeia archaeon]